MLTSSSYILPFGANSYLHLLSHDKLIIESRQAEVILRIDLENLIY